MKLIYVTPFLRVPPDFGLGIRNFQLVRYLSSRHRVTLVTYGDGEPQTDGWLAERGIGCVRLPIAVAWSKGRGRRDELRNLLYYPPSFFQRFAPKMLYDTLCSECARDGQAGVIVCDTALTGQVTLQGRLGARVITVLPDLYQRVQRQQLATVGLRPYWMLAWANLVKTRVYENRVLKSQRYLATVSKSDDEFVRKHFPQAMIQYAPNGVDTDAFKPNWVRPPGKGLLFVGGFEYAPNEDAFFYFCREILPRIRARDPEVCLRVVGRAPTAAMEAYAAEASGVELVGAAAEVQPFYAEAVVVVVPLRFGGGVKLKTLEAFAAGVPVVATSVGVEGIEARDGVHVCVADDAAGFAERVLELLREPGRGSMLARRARDLVCARYAWRAIAEGFEQFVETVAVGGCV